MVAADREQRVRERAHALWESEGGGDGEHHRHWLEAEGRVDEEDRLKAATPPAAAHQEKAGPRAKSPAARKAPAAKANAAGTRRPAASANGLSAR